MIHLTVNEQGLKVAARAIVDKYDDLGFAPTPVEAARAAIEAYFEYIVTGIQQ